MADSRLDLIAELRDNASKKIDALSAKINDMSKQVEKSSSSFGGMQGALSKMNQYFDKSVQASQQFATSIVAVGVGIGGLVGMGVKVAADLETARQGFITLLGSAEKADKTMNEIKIAAARTPFELVGLTQATQLLSSVTKDGSKAVKVVLDVGEALAAMGKGQVELDRIIVNLQQIAAVGKASMMDIKQFAFAGIPIFEMLTQATGKTGDALSDFISKGGVTFEMLTTMFDKANDAGGRFFNAYINQAGTFNQLLSNTKDVIGIFLADVSTKIGVFDALKEGMARFVTFLSENQGKMIEGIQTMMKLLQENLPLVAGMLTGALTPAFIALAYSIGSAVVAITPFIVAGALLVSLGQEIAREYGITWPMIKQVIFDSITQAKKKIEELHEFYKAQVQPQIKAVAKWFVDNWANISNAVDKAAVAIKAAVQFVIDFWNGVLKPALATVVRFFEENKTAIMAVWNGLWKAIENIFTLGSALIKGDMKKFLDTLINIIVGIHVTAWNAFKVLMAGLAEAIVTGVPIVIENVLKLIKEIKDKFLELVATAPEWGKNLVQGLINGIGGMAGAAQAKVGELANGVTGAFKNALGIHSPSKVFESLGAFTVEGFAIGMQKASHLPKKEAIALRDKLRDELGKLKELFDKTQEEYSKAGDTISQTMQDLAIQHKEKWDSMAKDIEGGRKAIQGFKKDYEGFIAGQGNEFGTKFVDVEKQLREAEGSLQTARVTGGSAEEIQAAQSRVSQLQNMYAQASQFLVSNKEQETTRIGELEASLAEKQRALSMTNDFMRKAQITVELQDLQTKLDYSKIKEESFAETQRTLAEGVERARRTANMNEMELFLFNMMEKRVQEKLAMEEKIKAEEDKIKLISDAMVKEMDMYTAKMKEIKVRQDIMTSLHKTFMENQTRKTGEEINKQIEFYNRLASAARDAYSAKSSVGVSYYADGGIVQRFASGGMARGTDTVPAMLTPGEVILNAAQQKNLSGKLGGGSTINIYIDTMIGDDEFAEKMGNKIVKSLQFSTAI